MSFLKKYACFYNNIEFTPQEQAEIGSFAASVIKLAAAEDKDGLVALMRQEFGDVDEVTFDRINRYTGWLAEIEKSAQVSLHNILAPLAVALAATPLMSSAFSAISGKMAQKNALKKAMEMYPELRGDPNVPMYFKAIASFAPKIAENALVAGNLLVQMHRIGPTAMTPQLLGELIGMQTKARPPVDRTEPLSKSVMEAAKIYSKTT